MDCDNGISNKSGNRPFQDVLKTRLSRRNVLTKGMMLSAAGFATALVGNKALVQAASAATGQAASTTATVGSGATIAQAGGLVNFEPVAVANGSGPVPSISEDYEYQVMIPWGSTLDGSAGGYDGDPNTRPTADAQKNLIGIGHDGMWLFPIGNGNDHGMLAINHEFGRNTHVLGKSDPESLEDVRLSQHAHGVSVVEIKKIGGKWQPVKSNNARRIHVNTDMTFSGPVAGHPLLDNPAGNSPQGTVNNCAYGKTPWGTYLTCEENFHGYFGDATGTWTPTEAQDRYGFSTDGFGYGWQNFDPRFDLSNPDYVNENHRFGWVVEIDPMDASQTPVKRTALGRIKHEGAEVTVGRGGRVVTYMGDDERFDYIYKFVSESNWRSMRARGISPLDRGKLYVAKFNDDGTGEWLELTIDNPALSAQFSDQGELLVNTRLAADTLGATPMDRPEWATVSDANGKVYFALTNNSQRTVPDAPNPEAPNPDGHILEIEDSARFTGTTFKWDIFILASSTRGTEAVFTDPDGLWADPDGRLFIETDGGQPDELNNQLVVANIETKELRRLFTGVTSDEITGLTVTPDRRTLFINTQHPGNGDPTLTNFPADQGSGKIPRDSTIVITRKNGGIVGS